jgi:UDP-N-acetylglucosamine--N-acetylmuramyl-(pentapeptide) pyrophosphoryl-undecaprenol N-acetylglucosamine transferase
MMHRPPEGQTNATPSAFASLRLTGRKLLIVASTGGHVHQAVKICDMVGASPDSLIVTFRSPQSEQLTKDRRVRYVPYVSPRDWKGILRAIPFLRQIFREERFDAVLSTGAGIALSALPFAPSGTQRIYIESFSRFDGASVTGRVARCLPRVSTYTQHPEWASRAWPYAGDVAPELARRKPKMGEPSNHALRVFVTLGTIKPYRFDSLVDRIRDTLPANAEVTWQLGCTDRTDLPGRVVDMMPADEFEATAQSADIVISHAGVGTAMVLVELGKYTVLVPRRAARGEHVDDHQVQVCRDFEARGLVVYREVDDLSSLDYLAPVA